MGGGAGDGGRGTVAGGRWAPGRVLQTFNPPPGQTSTPGSPAITKRTLGESLTQHTGTLQRPRASTVLCRTHSEGCQGRPVDKSSLPNRPMAPSCTLQVQSGLCGLCPVHGGRHQSSFHLRRTICASAPLGEKSQVKVSDKTGIERTNE